MSDIYIRDSENDLTYSESAGGYVLTSSLFDSYTLTIAPTPEDATVVISADGYSQSGNSLTAIEGTYVEYTVSQTGYRTVSGSVTLDSDKTISVSLVPSSIDNIDDAKTVRELEVNDTAYDIVGKGVLDQNNRTTNLEWIGTKAEYEALGAYSDKCTYIITDDSADSQSDEVGAIAEEVNTLKGYDYVVDWQVPTADNGYTWYRLYKSGWLEAGGRLSGRAITFPQAFAVPPTVSTSSSDTATICAVTINVYNITTTGFSGHRTQIADTWHTWEMNMAGYWLAAGMSA